MTEELLKVLLKNPLCNFNEPEHTQCMQILIDEYLSQEEQEKYQDDIGGGCGQLWYFQEWLKTNE